MNTEQLIKVISALSSSESIGEKPVKHRYVIVRCKDAGVHAGEYVSHNGRECVLKRSRRLWYWKPAKGAAFLSGVAAYGLDPSSKIGAEVDITLTECCEIIDCTKDAEYSIIEKDEYKP